MGFNMFKAGKKETEAVEKMRNAVRGFDDAVARAEKIFLSATEEEKKIMAERAGKTAAFVASIPAARRTTFFFSFLVSLAVLAFLGLSAKNEFAAVCGFFALAAAWFFFRGYEKRAGAGLIFADLLSAVAVIAFVSSAENPTEEPEPEPEPEPEIRSGSPENLSE